MESSAPKESLAQPSSSQWLIIDKILAAPKLAHARGQPHVGIFVTGVNYSFTPGSARPIDGLLTFLESSLRQLAQPHDEVLVLTLEVGPYLMKCMLIDPGSAVDLLYLPARIRLGYKSNNLCNPGRILVGFNGTQTQSLGEILLLILTSPIIAIAPLTVIDESSNFNAILS